MEWRGDSEAAVSGADWDRSDEETIKNKNVFCSITDGQLLLAHLLCE